MQYLIVETLSNDEKIIHLGPMNWRPTFFKNCLLDDLEIDFNVPLSNDSEEKLIVNDKVQIIPAKDIGIIGEFNPKIQIAEGPYYIHKENFVEMYYTPKDKEISLVKSELKSIVSHNRYNYEIFGIKVNIQDKIVDVLTSRGDRDLYLQAYQLGRNDVSWKFGNQFIILTNSDLGIITNSVINHVQSVFDWEAEKFAEIENAIDLDQLNDIILASDNPDWNPIRPQLEIPR